MKDWCFAHPYLTTVIFIMMLSTVSAVFETFVKTFKKPEVPNTVNLNVGIPTEHRPEDQINVSKHDEYKN